MPSLRTRVLAWGARPATAASGPALSLRPVPFQVFPIPAQPRSDLVGGLKPVSSRALLQEAQHRCSARSLPTLSKSELCHGPPARRGPHRFRPRRIQRKCDVDRSSGPTGHGTYPGTRASRSVLITLVHVLPTNCSAGEVNTLVTTHHGRTPVAAGARARAPLGTGSPLRWRRSASTQEIGRSTSQVLT